VPRTFRVANGNADRDFHVSAQVTNGGIVKAGPGTLHLSGANTYEGGTVVNDGFVGIEAEENLGAAPVSFSAGHLTLDGGGLRATTDVTIDHANRGITLGSNGGTFDVGAGATLSVANLIAGDDGDLIKTGAGTLELTGANTYSSSTHGPEVNHGTFLESGILLVNNTSGSGTGDGDVIVAGGTLSGHGAIGGNVRFAPNAGATITTAFDGISDRTLAIGGDLDMKTGNTWLVDLVRNIDGASSRIDIAGTLLLMAGTELSFNFSGDYTGNHVYTIASYGSLSGLFTQGGSLWADGTERIIGGNPYVINYQGASNTITLTAVPEPGTWLVTALASGIGWFVRKRRRRIVPRRDGE
jgi:autotransporter-associated beta strand protein